MMRLPWRGKSVPHAVLDILRGCNCRCRYCYNMAEPRCKGLAELREELAVIRRERNVTTITLSGGEPLMHPDVLKIVAWLREEGIVPSLLTNGVLLDDELAAGLRNAGLKIVTLHIQRGQHRPDAVDDTRETVESLRIEKARLARRHGLYPALVSTICGEDAAAFAEMARFIRTTAAYEYALVTVARSFGAIDPRTVQSDVDPAVFLKALADEGYRPAVFVGGRACRTVPRWYIFQSVRATDASGRETAWNVLRPSFLERAFLSAYAAFCGRSIHWVRSTSAGLKFRLLVNGLTGGHFSSFLFAFRAVIFCWRLQEKHIIIQLPPYSLGGGEIECCDNCPDATVKDGRLHPLCLSDVPVGRVL